MIKVEMYKEANEKESEREGKKGGKRKRKISD